MKKEKISDESNSLQIIFYALVKKMLPTWKEASRFAEKNGIKINTMKDVYYKEGKVGVQVMSMVLNNLLKISPKKIDEILNLIHTITPVSESTKIWNSISADEEDKVRVALYSKAILEIEKKLNN